MGIGSYEIIVEKRRAGGLLDVVREVGASATAVVVGAAALADEVAAMGYDKVILFETEEGVPPEALAMQVSSAIAADEPQLVISTDAAPARVILGAVAGKIDAATVGSVIALKADDDRITATRSIANGRAVEDVELGGRAAIIYTGEDVEAASAVPAAVEKAAVDSANGIRIIKTVEAGSAEANLATAARIVGVGMGIKSRDDLPIAESLATALDAQIACTLPACDDMHWFSSERVLGSSHNSAAPELYIALGISGSPHHTSGVRDSKVVVAVNDDPDAEMFRNCNYGVVGDLYKIVPVLTEALNV